MRIFRAIGLIVMIAVLTIRPPAGRAQTSDIAPELEQAMTKYHDGDVAGALALAEKVLTHSPDDENALYRSALFNFQLNNIDAARGRLERLVKLSGSYFSAWELMVQVTQAQGDLARRDEAIDRLKLSIKTALDPDIRVKSDFIRERIRTGDQDVMVADYFTRGGSDFTRYQFVVGDPHLRPDNGLLLRTDAATTENWADTALMPPDSQLFHLDMVDPKPQGGDRTAIYAYYVGEPAYDVVRAKVMEILRGEAKPLSGEPGSLQGIMKK
jgi:tetratricopeptide (TPR) repeat protein